MRELIFSEIKDNVFYITLNNPSSQNTLSLEIINTLNEIIIDSAKDNAIKVIIIRSVGKIFSAGHNLKEISLHRQDGDKGLKFFTTYIPSISNYIFLVVADVFFSGIRFRTLYYEYIRFLLIDFSFNQS